MIGCHSVLSHCDDANLTGNATQPAEGHEGPPGCAQRPSGLPDRETPVPQRERRRGSCRSVTRRGGWPRVPLRAVRRLASHIEASPLSGPHPTQAGVS